MITPDDNPPSIDWLPWARFNLHRNPFGELTQDERAELAVVEIGYLTAMLGDSRQAVQFIGQCGRGKTTRMLKLRSNLPTSSYTYIPEQPPCPAIASGNPILIDEAQRLSRSALESVLRSRCPLVFATHKDLGRSLRKHGYRVHTEHIGKGNSPKLICELLNRRIEASRLHSGDIPVLSMEDAESLVAEFGSDIRGIENSLYLRFQKSLEGGGDGEM